MTIYTKTVTPDVFDIFSLKESDFHILNHYGRHGPVFRNSIDLTKELSRRHTARQIDLLYERGYLHLIKSKKYRSSNKFTKLYGLSIKGFIASLYEKNIEDNYFFKQYISLFPEEFQIPVTKFLRLCIIEFILYHKSIGLKIDNIYDMSKYIKDIIYDYDLISDKDDLKKFKKINNDIVVIDEIRDILENMKGYEFDDDDDEEYIITSSGFDFDEHFFDENIIENINDHFEYPRESIKFEFLINFWPYIIDNIGKGTDLESELRDISMKSAPFGLNEYEEDITKFFEQKKSMIDIQWSKRKLNFQPSLTLTLSDMHSRKYF